MVKAQGGDDSVLRDADNFDKAPFTREVLADCDGFVAKMNAELLGKVSVMLGAGRETKDSAIDFSAGIVLHKKFGDEVHAGDSLATLYASDEKLFDAATKNFRAAVEFGSVKPEARPLIFARVEAGRVERF